MILSLICVLIVSPCDSNHAGKHVHTDTHTYIQTHERLICIHTCTLTKYACINTHRCTHVYMHPIDSYNEYTLTNVLETLGHRPHKLTSVYMHVNRHLQVHIHVNMYMYIHAQGNSHADICSCTYRKPIQRPTQAHEYTHVSSLWIHSLVAWQHIASSPLWGMLTLFLASPSLESQFRKSPSVHWAVIVTDTSGCSAPSDGALEFWFIEFLTEW